jgi:hypothetical protein
MQPVADLVVAERFRLSRLLGRGGMGSVWLAHHIALDIPCAVKFIEGEYALLAEAQARFEREAKAAAALRSPHVVQILDHGLWQGTPYMVMELLEGEDVGKRLGKVGRMSPKDVCTILTQVTRALTKAHAAGIVHRDLKPDNIFLVRDDDREIAKVLDFGIAKSANQALEGSATKTGAMLGTPYYMSPEQAQGIKAVDHRSDLWSLAVIVFQALTGRLPFESEALGDLLVKIIVAPIPMPTQLAPDLPASLDRWWQKAANRDPAQRYQSAKELCDGLSLVFGQSQLTDVMDRSELRAALASDPGVGRVPTPAGYGGGAIPKGTAPLQVPFNTPPPHGGMQATPQPGGYPQQMQATPYPGQAPQAPYGTTGAPMARTFGDTPVPPKSKTGLVVGVAAGVLVLVATGIGGAMALRSKKEPPTAAAGGGPAPSALPAVPPVASSVTLAPPAPSSTASVAAIDPTPAAPTATATPEPRPHPAAAPARPAQPAAPPAPAAPQPAKPGKKPSDVDLGI